MSIGQQTGALRLRYPHTSVEDALKELWGDNYDRLHTRVFGGTGNRTLFEYYVTRPLNDYYFDMIRHRATTRAVPFGNRGPDDPLFRLRENLDRWEGPNSQRPSFTERGAQTRRPHSAIQQDEEDTSLRQPLLGGTRYLRQDRPAGMVLAPATDDDEDDTDDDEGPPTERSMTQIPDSQPQQAVIGGDDDTTDDETGDDDDDNTTPAAPVVTPLRVDDPVRIVPAFITITLANGQTIRTPIPRGLNAAVRRMVLNPAEYPNAWRNPNFQQRLADEVGTMSPVYIALYGHAAPTQRPQFQVQQIPPAPRPPPPPPPPPSQAPTLRINDPEDESEDSDLEF